MFNEEFGTELSSPVIGVTRVLFDHVGPSCRTDKSDLILQFAGYPGNEGLIGGVELEKLDCPLLYRWVQFLPRNGGHHHVTLVIPRARSRCRHCDCDACKNQSAFYKELSPNLGDGRDQAAAI